MLDKDRADRKSLTDTHTGRRLCSSLLLGLGFILLSGCPDEDISIGEGETGETGEPPPAEPLDPFEGEGSDPPGDPDPDAEWDPPITLGNGLVYDTRFDIAEQSNTYSKDVTGMDLTAGIDWSSFVTPHATKVGYGFRPTAVDADVSLTPTPTGGLTLEVVDRSTYLADDESNYRHETHTYVFEDTTAELALALSGSAGPGEARPISIDTFVLPSDASLGDTIVWVYDSNPVPWKIVTGEGGAVFPTTVANLASQNYRPISVASRQRDGGSEYSAIFVADGVPVIDGKLDIGLSWSTIGDAGPTVLAGMFAATGLPGPAARSGRAPSCSTTPSTISRSSLSPISPAMASTTCGLSSTLSASVTTQTVGTRARWAPSSPAGTIQTRSPMSAPSK